MTKLFKRWDLGRFLRTRNYILVGGSLATMGFLYATDPNHGILTLQFLSQLATPIIAVWFAYLARTALFDYLDMQELYVKAKENAIAASIVFVGICLIMFALLGLFGNSARAEPRVDNYIPEKAYVYIPVVKSEQKTFWLDHPKQKPSLP